MSRVFGFPVDVDPVAARAAREPLRRRDAVISVLLLVLGALGVGAAGGATALEAVLWPSSGTLPAIVVTGLLPLVCWAIGAALALLRLRDRRRAWVWPLLGIAGIVVFGAIGIVWWLHVAGLA